jgi:hypothetical protein
MLFGISCELAGCVHRPIVDSESTNDSWLRPNQTLVSYTLAGLAELSRLSSIFKTPASTYLQNNGTKINLLLYSSTKIFESKKELKN